jgi:pimeloyl-ACP methyl ester carboxylesterase
MADHPSRGATYDGHRVWYRVAGSGPALVLVRQNRVPADDRQLQLFSDRFTVLQVTPIGFGASERPAGYRPSDGVAPHILAAIDQEGIDRFAVWGYSQGAAMAAAVARATPRAVAMVCGGNPLIGVPTPGTLRRLDREPRLPVGAHAFWHWYASHDWDRELRAMECTKIVYFGSEDNPALRRRREQLITCGVDVHEFAGLDHHTCNSGPDFEQRVMPAVVECLAAVHSCAW